LLPAGTYLLPAEAYLLPPVKCMCLSSITPARRRLESLPSGGYNRPVCNMSLIEFSR
jgi:hypothetical protein